LVATHFFVLDHLHVEESFVELLIVQVVNNKLFVAARSRGELDTLLHLAVRLQKGENGQLIQVVVILLHEGKELLLQDLHLLLLDHDLLASKRFVNIALFLSHDFVGANGRNF